MKCIVIDLDGTLTHDEAGVPYPDKRPNIAVVERLRAYKAEGFRVVMDTARNMRTHENSIGKINAFTLPVIIAWLDRHAVPYDEVHVGKPWCGTEGFLVDDRAIRPDEFVTLSHAEILARIGRATAD
jgi:capsule biosynthesis phosphatase